MRRERLHRPASSSGVGIKMGIYAGIGIVACCTAYWALRGHDGTSIPVVTADARPIRVRPADPGGLNVNQTGNFVFSGDPDDSQARLAPPAEAPNTKALRASEKIRAKTVKPNGDHLSEPGIDG
jgi:hypothetical protein